MSFFSRAKNALSSPGPDTDDQNRVMESEQRYRALFESANDAILIMNSEQFVECNMMSVTLFGCDGREDIIGRPPWELSPSVQPDGSESRDKALAIIHKALSGEPQRFFWSHSRKDGTPFDAEVSLSRLEAGKEILLQALVRDVTEHTQMEHRLRKSEEYYRTLVETSPEAIVIIDAEGKLVFASQKAHDLFGVPRDQSIAGRSMLHWIAPEDHPIVQDRMRDALAGEAQPYSREYRLRKENGTPFWSEIASSSLVDARGQVTGLLLVCHDVSERKAAEKALRESEERFSRLADASFEGIVVSEKGKVIDLNDQLAEMLQYPRAAMLGMDVVEFVAPESLKVVLQHLRSGTEASYVHMALRRDGSTFPVEVRAKAIPSNGDNVTVTAIRDITERKRAEEVVRDSEERYRMVFEHVFDGISMYSEDPDPSQRRLIECNDRYADLAGRSREELLKRGSTHGLQIPVEDTANHSRLESLKRGTEYKGSFSWIRPDGKDNLIEYVGMPITWRGQLYSIGIDRDITERKKAEESQLLLTTALESTANGVVITDLKGDIVWVNKAFTEMTGYTRTEAVGHNPRILKSGKQDDGLYTDLWKTISEGNVWHGELINKKKDGSLYTDEMTITPLKRANGGITHFIAIKQDITERKNAERELRLMAQTVASARDCISITDLGNRLLFANDAFQMAYGYTTEELVGKDVSIVRSPHVPAEVANQILRDTLAGGWHGEILNRRKDGSDFPVELWTSVVRDEAGMPVALVGVARDITDRNRAQEHLRQSEELFRLIAENVADMIAVLDLNGRRIYNSPSYKGSLADPESLRGTDGFQDIHPDDRDMVKQVFQETVRTGIGQRIEYRLLRKGGSERTIDSKGSVIRDRDGKISQVIVVSRDVTEEKRLAAHFLRAQRMESIGTLAGGIAHDLNNVLAPIMMAIEVLKNKMPDPGGQKILKTIETSAKRGSDIVRQVLTFGRGVKGERIVIQLKHLFSEVVKIAGETFPKSIEIKTDFPRELWTVSADPTQMHQVFLNILVNARDAMPTGGTLTLSAENMKLDETYSRMHLEAKPGAYVSVAITDTGTGIPADIRDKIFEPFFTTKEVGAGTGLGLSTTLAIVKNHGGFINVYSEVGKGTTFRVYIPATGTASGIAITSEEADLPLGRGELVLVIDDEAAIREITKEALQAYGYKAITASNGAEGVAVFAQHKENIKVVITDIMMPVMDGTAAILALKKIKPEVKIIAASGVTTKRQITPPSDSHIHGFLTKPYNAEKLLKALAAALR